MATRKTSEKKEKTNKTAKAAQTATRADSNGVQSALGKKISAATVKSEVKSSRASTVKNRQAESTEKSAAKTSKSASKPEQTYKSADAAQKTARLSEKPPKNSRTKKTASSGAKSARNQSPIDTSGFLPETEMEAAVTALDYAEARMDATEAEILTEREQDANLAVPDPNADIAYVLDPKVQIFVKTANVIAATGKTKTWIRDLTMRGIIQETNTNRGPLFDFVKTMRAYCEYLEERLDNRDSADADLKKKQAEARLKEAKASIEEMKEQEFRGKMHRSEDVQKLTSDLMYSVRGSLLALSGRCATECANASEPAVVQKIIAREVREILKEMSEYKYDPKRYDALVRERSRREIEDDFEDEDNEE